MTGTGLIVLFAITQEAVPWAIPIVTTSLIAAALIVVLGRRRWGGDAWAIAGLLVSGAVVIAITLTPNAGSDTDAFTDPRADPGPWGYLREPAYWFHLDDRSLNVALLIPLGLVVGLAARGGWRWVGLAAGLALPWVIEGLQFLLPFSRDPDLADVVDNSTGFALGWLVGVLIAAAISARSRPSTRAVTARAAG